MNDKVTYWIEMSDYDLETADAMLATSRYLYVGFMCHQTIEKILKAYWSNCFIRYEVENLRKGTILFAYMQKNVYFCTLIENLWKYSKHR